MEKLMQEAFEAMVHVSIHAKGGRRQQSETQNKGKGTMVDKAMSCVW